MKQATPFSGRIQGGKLLLDDTRGFERMVKLLEGKRIALQLAKEVRKRTLPQNRMYWGYVLKMLGDHLGYTAEELHEACKVKFLCIDPDAELPRYRSTTSLNTEEFNRYIEQIVQLAAELGCYIPDPSEVAA